MYACGLAVEGMLRSLYCLKSREYDEKHDLRKFAVRVQNPGLLRPERDDDFVSTVQSVAKYWRNTLRYADQKQLLRFLRAIGERLFKKDALNGFCERYYNQCAEVTKRCAALLARSRKLKIEKALAKGLRLKSPMFDLEVLPGGKISGSVVSDTFVGMKDSDRQKQIWDFLEKKYGIDSTKYVGTLLAYTDAEWNVDLAER